LPKGATPSVLKNLMQRVTVTGHFTANRMVELKDIMLPEFSQFK
jgi:hypothetical protein